MMNRIFSLSFFKAFALILLISSCGKEPDVDRVINQKSSKTSARLGVGTNSYHDCPDGYHYFQGDCIADETTDINPNTISFNTSASSVTTWQDHSEARIKFTPGSNNFTLLELYDYSNPSAPVFAGESLIIKIINSGSYTYTSYYNYDGKRIGILTSENQYFRSFAPDYTGSPDGPDFAARYFGNWGRCVAKDFGFMTNGTAMGSLTALGCAAFGPECAAAVGVSCAVAAAIWDY